MTSAWNQLEQLLTCAICLDRFRNPKLLPCQHTFCGEPCMEGLVDYARRQIKCPECRAEHRIPYNGVQTFPNNVTLARFLDLHREVTGEEPEPVPSMMERCGVCSEKAFCDRCSHCDKKVCSECKEGHLEILRREITRINSQIRRGLNKLTEQAQQTGRNSEKLQQNHQNIREEITESVRRFIKDLKDKEAKLLHELDEYTQTESKCVEKLKDDLDVELANLTSNCELTEKHITENDDWTDAELVEYKEIFMKTLEFLRNVDIDTSDFSRKIKFVYKTDVDVLRRSLIDFGELKISTPNVSISPSNSNSAINTLSVPANQNSLMRSQSDHRLAAQLQQQRRAGDPTRFLEISGSGTRFGSVAHSDSERDTRYDRATSPTSRRTADRLGRYGIDRREEERDTNRSRLLRDAETYTRSWPRPCDDEPLFTTTTPHFRSRFMRERHGGTDNSFEDTQDSDYGSGHNRSVRFEEPVVTAKVKVFETEEAIKGPLSGVMKLTDSPFVMFRLHQNEIKSKLKSEEEKPNPVPTPAPPSSVTYQPRRPPSRQVSEDEIEKQKKANQVAAAVAVVPQPVAVVPQSPTIPEVPQSPSRLMPRRVATLQKEDERVGRFSSSDSSRRGSSSDATIDDSSQIDEETGDSSGIARLARRRQASSDTRQEETEAASRVAVKQTTATQVRQVSSNHCREEAIPTPTGIQDSPAAAMAITAAANPAVTVNCVNFSSSTSSTSSADSSSTITTTTANTNTVNADLTLVVASSSPLSTLTSNNHLESNGESTPNSTELSDTQSRTKSGYVLRYTRDKRLDKPNDYVAYTPLVRNPSPTLQTQTTDTSTVSRYKPFESSLNSSLNNRSRESSRANSRSGSPENPGRRVSLEDFRGTGQVRPNYNPYRQIRPNISSYSPTLRESVSYNRNMTSPLSLTSPSSTVTSIVSPPSSYRRTLTTLGFPDSSNECAIIDWGINVIDFICYSIGFVVFITVIIYRSIRSPLGKTLSVTQSQDKSQSVDVINDNKSQSVVNRPSIGSDKSKDRRTISSESDSSESSDSSSSSSDSDSETDDNSPVVNATNTGTTAATTRADIQFRSERVIELPASVSTLLNRSAQARRDNQDTRNSSDTPLYGSTNRFARQTNVSEDQPSTAVSAVSAAQSATHTDRSSYKIRKLSDTKKDEELATSSSSTPSAYQPKRVIRRAATFDDEITPDDGSTSAYSRYLARNKPVQDPIDTEDPNKYSYQRRTDKYDTNTPSYRSRLSKSKSSHSVSGYDESDDENLTTVPTSPSYKSKYGNEIALPVRKISRSGYTYRTREQSPAADDEPVSQHSQYLINKYGSNRATSGSKSDTTKASILRSKSSHAVYGRSISSSDEEVSTSILPTRRSSRETDGSSILPSSYGFTYQRNMYLQKKKMNMKIGSRGTGIGCFTWPRGVTCAPNNNIVVADSSNHRVQVFDSTGRFIFEFGSYGSGDGEFDCLASVCVNRLGQYIVSDRYNHRIQIFDPSGRFLRTFGVEGRIDGRFSYPWGVTADALGFIYVCDKENHRIQVFQSDGTFVGKFGTIGSRIGMLEHPHYVAVSNTNRVIVSDSNNHRIQIFDVNGRALSVFGTEGSGDGQFKFPRGVAVDEQGYIIVGDSGNNRVQVFNPDGTFLKAFGTWGSGDGEFKGLEGLAISSTGNILVCDRENHRIQIF